MMSWIWQCYNFKNKKTITTLLLLDYPPDIKLVCDLVAIGVNVKLIGKPMSDCNSLITATK